MIMNLVRCDKGHFYDKDKNGDHCPYCAQMSSSAQTAAASAPQPAAPRQSAPARQPETPPVPQPSPQASAQTAPQPPRQEAQAAQPAAPQTPIPPVTPSGAVSGIMADTKDTMQSSVSEIMADTEDNCTIGYYSRVIGVEPVVGWLVCTEGEYRGESFKLKSGRNFIGRAANMDVVLSADHSISRYKHAAVIYEPRSRQFIVTAGESRELCYLNGDVVLSNMKMEAYDILNLGNTSLMLVPCCGKRFSWENGLEKEEEKEKA